MHLLDQDRVIIDVNPATIELMGYSRVQMVGRRLDAFLDPDEWQSLDAEWRAFQRRGSFTGVRSAVRADGRRVTVQYAAEWVRLEGRTIALTVALHTEVKPLRLTAEDLPPAAFLTPRELEVVSLVAMGQRAPEIADELDIAPSTVRSHLRSAMKKSGARSQAHLVALVCTGQMPRVTLTN